MARLQIDISDRLLDEIDQIVADEFFAGRREAIEAILREGILRRRQEENGETVSRRRPPRVASQVAEEE